MISLAAKRISAAEPPRSARLPEDGERQAGWPAIVASIDPTQAIARVNIWRANDAEFHAWLTNGAAPAVALRRLALQRWSAGQIGLASVMLATSAALDPDQSDVWRELGFTLQASGEPQQGVLALQHALVLDPTPPRGWLALGLAANQIGDVKLAEQAFGAALERDASLSDAAFGLGLIAFDQRHYGLAAQSFRRTLALGADAPLARVGLGQSLFFLGEYAAAAVELRLALQAGVAAASIVLRAALCHFLVAALEGDFDGADRIYTEIAGPIAEAPEAVAFAAFQILIGYGHRDAALALAKARLPSQASTPVQRYLIAAAAGQSCERAPDDYIVAHFDASADSFDRQLVEVLGYRAPQELIDMIGAIDRPSPRVLDLGCGTGLAGPLLRASCEQLIGIDLSPRMLEKAAARESYDELIEVELLSYLRQTQERFDLLFAADALVYFGDLTPVFAAAARATSAGALFAFNIETTNESAYELKSSGRFAHDLATLAEVAAPWFRLRTFRRAALRREGLGEAKGALVIMERRGSFTRASTPGASPTTLAA